MARVGSPKSQRVAKVRAGIASTAGLGSRVADLREVRLDEVHVPGHPARRFLGDINSLAASMDEYGLQQPISVRLDGDKYILTSGLRRLTAARTLGWTSIP